MASKVYYMNDRSSSFETSLVAKMLTVFDAAQLGEMIKPGDVVAIKMHCGEYNNTAYLRPVYPRALADKIKGLGGRPFVTDTTTLPYSPFASRCTALDEMLTAERNGINSTSLGCPFIVADGFIGKDDVRVDLPEGHILKEQYVARAIALADAVIVLTHFKGHPAGTIGGAIKNIGIGAASQRGKYNVHLGGHPRHGLSAAYYYPHLCLGRAGCPNWQLCEESCPYGLIHVQEHSVEIERVGCAGCYGCVFVMSACGVLVFPEETFDATSAGIADSALACMKAVGRDRMGFVNLAHGFPLRGVHPLAPHGHLAG